MNASLWFFLSVCVVFGVGFAMFLIYLNHQKTMKQMDIDAAKDKTQ